MPYLTTAELETAISPSELIALADRDGDGIADEAVVAGVLARADEVIDSYLRSRFTVPLASVPGMVRQCAQFIARYFLFEDQAPDRVAEDYRQALKWLEQIRKGELDIGIDGTGTAPEAGGSGPHFGGGREAFPRDALDLFAGEP